MRAMPCNPALLEKGLNVNYQQRYDKLKGLDAKALARLVPACCKPKPIPKRAPFAENAPPRFPAWISHHAFQGMRFIERPADRYPAALKWTVKDYIEKFCELNMLNCMKFELVSGALFPENAAPMPEAVPVLPETVRAPIPAPVRAPIVRSKRYVITQDGRRIAA